VCGPLRSRGEQSFSSLLQLRSRVQAISASIIRFYLLISPLHIFLALGHSLFSFSGPVVFPFASTHLRRGVPNLSATLLIETASSYGPYDRASCYGLCHVQYDWTFERHGCNPLIWQYTILKAVEGYAACPRWSRRTCGGIIMRTWV
jgi:hypothetical protein